MADIDPPVWKLRWTDLWWLLAYPVYQTLGTIRHEGSHALVAKLEGADVTKFVIYPQTDLGRFTWGYTQWNNADTDWLTLAAPYFCDLLWFVGFFFLLTRLPWRNHLIWLNLAILGLLSPLLNSGVQWIAGFLNPDSDVARIRDAVPDVLVQLYFLLTLAAYVIGILAIYWRGWKVSQALLPATT